MESNSMMNSVKNSKPRLLKAVIDGDVAETKRLVEANWKLLTEKFDYDEGRKEDILSIAHSKWLEVGHAILTDNYDYSKRSKGDLEEELFRREAIRSFLNEEYIKRKLRDGGYL